jgi:hypothetical protein
MKHPTPDQWRELVAEFHESGLQHKEFVAKHDVHLGTFQYWLYKNARERRNAAQIVSKSSPKFLPLQVLASPAPKARVAGGVLVEVALPSGAIVRFVIGTDTRYLAELCAALG